MEIKEIKDVVIYKTYCPICGIRIYEISKDLVIDRLLEHMNNTHP